MIGTNMLEPRTGESECILFSKNICLKVNVTVNLEFELVYIETVI